MNAHRLAKIILPLLLLMAGTIYIAIEQRTMPYHHTSGKIFGTTYHITYQSRKPLDAEILAAMDAVDNSLSTFNKQSTISRLNRGEDIVTDAMFEEVFSLAQKISEETDGAFDITVAPLVNVWGFGFEKNAEPTQAVLDSLLLSCGYQGVKLHNHHLIRQSKATMLDCSAIAKGYGADMVAKALTQHGCDNFMVEIGGEIVVRGHNEKRKEWTVGIMKPNDDPTQQNKELQHIVSLTNQALATSGNYRNFYYKDGRKYAHTIHPKTGRPVQHSLLSATVIAPNCAMADAYATAFMVMGMDATQQFLKNHTYLKVYLIYADKDGEYQTFKN